MAGYITLRQGNSNTEENKKLQQALKDAGYGSYLGSAGVDGIYGAGTAAAVKAYQKDNGLAVDGIAGNQTLGSLYGSKQSSSAGTNPETGKAVPDYSKFQYDPGTNAAYQQAVTAMQQAQQSVPTYQGTYDRGMQELYNQFANREKFSYDVNADALYQQYRDQYAAQGKLAMMDAMGQAAALGGGYGSSYAQGVGQQAYQGYLQQLNAVVPELYGMAYDRYQQEGQDLLTQYSMLTDMANTEYGRYQDDRNQYWQNLSYQKQLADDAYDRGYQNWYNAYQMGVDAENTAYSRQQANYEKLAGLITSTGYTPTEQELQAAGMRREEAASYASYYGKSQVKSTGGSSSGKEESGRAIDYKSMGYDNYNDMTAGLALIAEEKGNEALWNKLSEYVVAGYLDAAVAESIYKYYAVDKDTVPKYIDPKFEIKAGRV